MREQKRKKIGMPEEKFPLNEKQVTITQPRGHILTLPPSEKEREREKK